MLGKHVTIVVGRMLILALIVATPTQGAPLPLPASIRFKQVCRPGQKG